MRTQLEADVRAILRDGGDPAVYRTGLAQMRRVSLEAVDAAIAAVGGTPTTIHPETLASQRLADEHRFRHTATSRAYHHEEE